MENVTRTENAAWRNVVIEACASTMGREPHLAEDGHTLVIPSEPGYFNEKAKVFYREVEARWDGDGYAWALDTRTTTFWGKRYATATWLKLVRKRYFEIWGWEEGQGDE